MDEVKPDSNSVLGEGSCCDHTKWGQNQCRCCSTSIVIATVNQLDDRINKEDPIVDEFPNVFSDDLPGMPPDHDIEFIIELLPKTAPISKRLYRMGVNELEDLKKQIKEL